ncbi:MAG TPA: xanthine dehydrogenase family protein molybdopterin-binding subunit [Pyrinomonadaceae bacterium]|nr:xanthine dehydrogenase family protein molybdopterin-binding subunit [Pyrinomonadaceae bacterium]
MADDDIKDGPNRVDGILKATGKAKYIAEWRFPNMAYGYLVHSTIAKGKIREINTAEAEKQTGVIKVLTHLNTPKFAKAETDKTHRPLHNADILFSGQAIGVVVAETFERARYAASLVKVVYDKEPSETDLRKVIDKAYMPGRPRPNRGNPEEAFAKSEFKIEVEYTIPIEHHNAMELHASVANWENNKLTIYDKTQGVNGVRGHLAGIFGIPQTDITVLAPFVGGTFGASLRPSPNVFLTALAAREVKRPVKLVYSRRQLFTAHGYRPYSIQKIKMSADKSGKLTAILHESLNNTSSNEDFSENMTGISRTMYSCPNVKTEGKIAHTDLQTPLYMRAPGTVSGMFALESAMDELSYKLKIDPLELRLINYAETDPESGKPFSSKELRKCYSEAAKKFGWEKRKPEPRSMQEGNWLIGYGMATGTWGAGQAPASAKITLKSDGTALIESSVTDIGPGTYTTLSIIASKNLGLPIEKIKAVLGDSTLPSAPSQGGSITTASVGTAVQEGSQVVLKKLFDLAKFGDYKFEDVKVENGKFVAKDGKAISFVEILQKNNLKEFGETYSATPNNGERSKYAIASHGAQFVEVKVDEELGIVRVTRVVELTAAGKIINPKGAHSQEMGGVVWGIGMALTEETQIDHRYGRIMNPNFAGYYVPSNADVLDIDTGFVEEVDKIVNPLGVKGLGELGMVGVPAAIANAVYHATGKRFRNLPITPDKFL